MDPICEFGGMDAVSVYVSMPPAVIVAGPVLVMRRSTAPQAKADNGVRAIAVAISADVTIRFACMKIERIT